MEKPLPAYFGEIYDEAKWQGAGIPKPHVCGTPEENGRKIVCHSLRCTYVTRMRRELPAETVMKMVRHTNVEMTDYYTDKRAIDESIAGLIGAASAADNLFV